MGPRTLKVGGWKPLSALLAGAILCFLLLRAAPQSKQPTQPAPTAFATPEKAVEALVQAAKSYDVPSLIKILGPDAQDLVSSEDPVNDKNRSLAFAALADQKKAISLDPKYRDRAILLVGNEDWPFPIA